MLFWNLPKKKELSAHIAELTELLEELRSEKTVVLQHLQCVDDSSISSVKKEIAKSGAGLKRLDEQEEKHASELDSALKQYAELREQAVELAPLELYEARQAICPEKERSAAERVQKAYGDKYSPLAMFDSKREASSLLHEYADEQLMQNLKRVRRKNQMERKQNRHKHKSDRDIR